MISIFNFEHHLNPVAAVTQPGTTLRFSVIMSLFSDRTGQDEKILSKGRASD